MQGKHVSVSRALILQHQDSQLPNGRLPVAKGYPSMYLHIYNHTKITLIPRLIISVRPHK